MTAATGRFGQPRKIAVLGGGIGSLAAVFELTSDPDWRDKYDITVYQVGWRLGGKGASGRADHTERRERDGQPVDVTTSVIREHGLHIWPGFYENAFSLVHRCYADLPPAGSFGWEDAFEGLSHVFFSEHSERRSTPWRVQFPRNRQVPGLGGTGDVRAAALTRRLLEALVRALSSSGLREEAVSRDEGSSFFDLILDRARGALGAVAEAMDNASTVIETVVLRIAGFLTELRDLRRAAPPTHLLRRTGILFELGGTILRGLIADEVPRRGFDHLDEIEWSDWLRRHGADEDILKSAVVRGCYDFAFAYQHGSPGRPAMAAGAGTQMLLRMLLTYKGKFFYKMKASMGEVIFAPLYLVLERRGVTFRFFHRVTALRPSSAGSSIDEIEIVRQADVIAGPEAYAPLVPGHGRFPSWPSAPLLGQLRQGDTLGRFDLECFWTPWQGTETLRLRRGIDFDTVVLGISIGALRWICADLITASPKWRNMVTHVTTIPTQALQLWLSADHGKLGAVQTGSIVTAFAKPFDTWADMSHILEVERWPTRTVKTLAYFCGSLEEVGPLPDQSATSFPAGEAARVRANVHRWMTDHLPALWPGFSPRDVEGTYISVNINPSDRYVLTAPGSTKYRLAPGGSGFANLYLAGDWVANEINGGCVEGAVLAGLGAAKALAAAVHGLNRRHRRPESHQGGASALAAERSALPWRLAFGVGQLQAAMLTLAVPQEVVASQLPSRLRLLGQEITARGTHPVAVMFNRQSDVRPNLFPFRGISYPEFGVLVPFVGLAEADQERRPMAYVADLRVGSRRAQLYGIPYGYMKRIAQFEYRADSYRLTAEGTVVAEALLHPVGPPQGFQALPHLSVTRQIIEQPMVSVDGIGLLHYSYLEMHLDEAEVWPLAGTLSLNAETTARPIIGIDRSPLGAFGIRTSWTLTTPLQSPSLALAIARGQ